MKRIVSALICALAVGAAHHVASRARTKDAFARICALTAADFYRADAAVTAWIERCRHEAAAWPATAPTAALLERAQALLDELDVSHFNVFGPAADQRLWRGVDVHTGIHARYVDGHLVIYRVTPRSPAADRGLRPGDEILSLPGVEYASPAGAAQRAGEYQLARRGRPFAVTLAPASIVEDGAMAVEDLAGGARRLTIPSFRAEFFDRDVVRAIGARLAGSARVVIDLRENVGGNYGATLRALALFLPAGTRVGTLVQPRRAGAAAPLRDDVDDEDQMEQLERYARLELAVPAGYPRYDGPVTALIANDSASAAEVFADALRSRPRARLFGWPTAGSVVLAVWYALPELGAHYSLSLPRAAYVNARGENLEGHGVRPDRELYHDLDASLRGEDSWINAAVR